jgi:hypothetical protein
MKVLVPKVAEMAIARSRIEGQGFLQGLAKNPYYKKANDDFKGEKTKWPRALKINRKNGSGLADGSLKAQIAKNIEVMKLNCPTIGHLISRMSPKPHSAENQYMDTSRSGPKPHPPTAGTFARPDTGFGIITAETLAKHIRPPITSPGKGLKSPQFLGSDLATPKDYVQKFNSSPA